MTKLYPTLVALMAAGFISGHTMALTKAEYDAEKDRVEATYKPTRNNARAWPATPKTCARKKPRARNMWPRPS